MELKRELAEAGLRLLQQCLDVMTRLPPQAREASRKAVADAAAARDS